MIIGYVGRIAKEKGIRVLVQAAHILPDVTILVAGSGPLDDEVRSSAPANMRMLGRVADPRSVYAESDIVAVPSLEEGQGITALEAMAQGCPIVASDVGGLGAMLDNGVTALLVPPGDPESLARALRQLLESPVLAANLSVNAYKVAARDYRLSNMMQSLYNLYSNVTQSP